MSRTAKLSFIPPAFERAIGYIAMLGPVYASMLIWWPSPVFWWSAISWGATAGAAWCACSYYLCGDRQALRWAAVCGILAGGFAWIPLFAAPGPAAFFRLFLPFVLRRALRLPIGAEWPLATLLLGAALPFAPELVDVVLMAGLFFTIFEFFAQGSGLRWVQDIAACLVIPLALSSVANAWLNMQILGTATVFLTAYGLIAYATSASATSALSR